MQPRTPSSTINRTSRRHNRQGGYDIADVYEARLLAQGIRADDFVLHRSTSDAPSIPAVTPIRFGRGSGNNPFPAIAAPEQDSPAEFVSEESAAESQQS